MGTGPGSGETTKLWEQGLAVVRPLSYENRAWQCEITKIWEQGQRVVGPLSYGNRAWQW